VTPKKQPQTKKKKPNRKKGDFWTSIARVKGEKIGFVAGNVKNAGRKETEQ